MKLLIFHEPHESIDAIANIFDSTNQVEPYEEVIASNNVEVMQSYGHILGDGNKDMEEICDILNDWFHHDDSNLFFVEQGILKRANVANPQAKYYKWGIDYESMKTFASDYVETINITDWDILGQYREEYDQSRYYWKSHDAGLLGPEKVARYDALCAMVPHAIIVNKKWIQGPSSETFDVDLINSNINKMKTDMRTWIIQATHIVKSCNYPTLITSIYYK